MILGEVKGPELTTQKQLCSRGYYYGAVIHEVKGRNHGGCPGFLRIITKSSKTVPL